MCLCSRKRCTLLPFLGRCCVCVCFCSHARHFWNLSYNLFCTSLFYWSANYFIHLVVFSLSVSASDLCVFMFILRQAFCVIWHWSRSSNLQTRMNKSTWQLTIFEAFTTMLFFFHIYVVSLPSSFHAWNAFYFNFNFCHLIGMQKTCTFSFSTEKKAEKFLFIRTHKLKMQFQFSVNTKPQLYWILLPSSHSSSHLFCKWIQFFFSLNSLKLMTNKLNCLKMQQVNSLTFIGVDAIFHSHAFFRKCMCVCTPAREKERESDEKETLVQFRKQKFLILRFAKQLSVCALCTSFYFCESSKKTMLSFSCICVCVCVKHLKLKWWQLLRGYFFFLRVLTRLNRKKKHPNIK